MKILFFFRHSSSKNSSVGTTTPTPNTRTPVDSAKASPLSVSHQSNGINDPGQITTVEDAMLYMRTTLPRKSDKLNGTPNKLEG